MPSFPVIGSVPNYLDSLWTCVLFSSRLCFCVAWLTAPRPWGTLLSLPRPAILKSSTRCPQTHVTPPPFHPHFHFACLFQHTPWKWLNLPCASYMFFLSSFKHIDSYLKPWNCCYCCQNEHLPLHLLDCPLFYLLSYLDWHPCLVCLFKDLMIKPPFKSLNWSRLSDFMSYSWQKNEYLYNIM